MKIVLLTLLLLAVPTVRAQLSPADTTFAKQLVEQGVELQSETKFEDAILKYEEAYTYFDKARLLDKKLMCKNRVMLCLYYTGKFDEAIDLVPNTEEYETDEKALPEVARYYNILGAVFMRMTDANKALVTFDKSLEMKRKIYGDVHEEIAKSMNALSVVAMETGKYDVAEEYLVIFKDILDSLHIEGQTLNSMYYNNSGFIYGEKGDHRKAYEFYKKSLEVDEVLLGPKHPRIVTYYNNIGNSLMSMGELDHGLEHHQRSLALALELYGENHMDVARSHETIGNIYFEKGEYARSLEFDKQSIQIKEAVLGKDNLSTAVTYENMSSSFIELGELDRAFEAANKSLEIRKEFLEPDNVVIGQVYLDIARIHELRDEHEQETEVLNTALEIFLKSYGERAILVAETYYELAKNAFEEDPERGLELIEKALTVSLREGNPNPTQELSIDLFLSPLKVITILHEKGKFLSEVGEIESAISTYELCGNLIDQLRIGFMNQTDKILLSNRARSIYSDALKLSADLYSTTSLEEHLLKAFYFSGKGRSVVLQEGVAIQEARTYAGIPDSLVEKEYRLKMDLAFNRSLQLDEMEAAEKDSSLIVYYGDNVLELKRSIENLNELLKSQYPEYFSLRNNPETAEVATIQKELSDNMSYIEFVDLGSEVFAFLIDKNNFELKKVTIDSLLLEWISTLNLALETGDIGRFKESSYQVYRRLVDPLQLESKKLLIVPDGIIWNINFDILLTENSNSDDFKALPYLIRKHEVSYLYSSEGIKKTDLSIRSQPVKECLAFSYENNSESKLGDQLAMEAMRDSKLSDLPGTREEIKAISKVMDGAYYYGSHANERNFKQNVTDYKIIHLALHGEIDHQDPMRSKLYFTQEEDSLEDNFLHAFEIYNLELNADLAVLSACNTGVGQLTQGEGMMSLARAFAYTGCKSLVMSQWEVSDSSTPKIMEGFYSYLKEGKTKSEALRLAKLDYLREASVNLSNPYQWAPLIHIGNDQEIEDSKILQWTVLIGIFIVAGLFLMRKNLA